MASKSRGGLSKREYEAKMKSQNINRQAASKVIQTVKKNVSSTPKKASDYNDLIKQRNQGDERATYADKQTVKNILAQGGTPNIPTNRNQNISGFPSAAQENQSSNISSSNSGGSVSYSDKRGSVASGMQLPDFDPKVDTKGADKAAKEGEAKAKARAGEMDSFYNEFLNMKMQGIDRDYASTKEELGQTYDDLKSGLETQKAETEADYKKLTSDLEVQRSEQKGIFAKAQADLKKGLEEDQKKLVSIFSARGTLHSSEFERVWADATTKFQDKLSELNTNESNQMLKIDNAFNKYTEDRINALNAIENKINSAVKSSALALAKLDNEYRTRKDYTLADYKKDKLGVQAALDKQLYDIEQDKQQNITALKNLATEQQKFRWQVQQDLADIAFKEDSLDLQRQRVNIEGLKAAQANESGLPSGFYMTARQSLNDSKGQDGKADRQVFDDLRSFAIDQGYGNEFDKQFFNSTYLSDDELKALDMGGSSERFITLPDGTKIPY